jgi:hypothetical protein
MSEKSKRIKIEMTEGMEQYDPSGQSDFYVKILKVLKSRAIS